MIVLLTLANGVFSGAEIAVLSIRKTRVRELIEEGNQAARSVHKLRHRPERFLATVQIGITVVSSTAAAFGGATLSAPISSALESTGLSAKHADDVALALVVAIVSYLSLVIGELVPKSLALRYAERFSLLIARPLLLLSSITKPLVWLLTVSSNVVLRPFKDTTNFAEARLSPEELQQLVEEAGTAGTVDRRTSEIASRALEFGKIRVGAAMVPRDQMVTLPIDATHQDARRLLLEHPFSRLPVYEDNLDNIIGYVTSHDLLVMVESRSGTRTRDIVRPPFIVPESALASRVLNEMQQQRTHMALVVDEQGTIAGLVTLEDLVEELVGDILSETDSPIELIRKESNNTAWVLGRASIHEVNRTLDLSLPIEPGWSTIAGLVCSLAGCIPRAGTRIDAPDGIVIEVIESSARRVHAVRVTTPESSRSNPDDNDDESATADM